MNSVWLIETYNPRGTQYFTIIEGTMTYNSEINVAIQFSRKQDAELMMKHIFFNASNISVVEHWRS